MGEFGVEAMIENEYLHIQRTSTLTSQKMKINLKFLYV